MALEWRLGAWSICDRVPLLVSYWMHAWMDACNPGKMALLGSKRRGSNGISTTSSITTTTIVVSRPGAFTTLGDGLLRISYALSPVLTRIMTMMCIGWLTPCYWWGNKSIRQVNNLTNDHSSQRQSRDLSPSSVWLDNLSSSLLD